MESTFQGAQINIGVWQVATAKTQTFPHVVNAQTPRVFLETAGEAQDVKTTKLLLLPAHNPFKSFSDSTFN